MIFSVCSLKGGVGKSSISCFFAESLARQDKKVLLIDLDPQASATDFFLPEMEIDDLERLSVYNAFTSNIKTPAELDTLVIHNEGRPSIIPSTLELHNLNYLFQKDITIHLRFKKLLQKYIQKKGFDYAIVDTPPSLSVIMNLSIMLANKVIIPVSLDRWSLKGYIMMKDLISDVNAGVDDNIEIQIIPAIVSQNEADKLSTVFENSPITKNFIPRSASVRSSLLKTKSLTGKMQAKYDEVFKELLKA